MHRREGDDNTRANRVSGEGSDDPWRASVGRRKLEDERPLRVARAKSRRWRRAADAGEAGEAELAVFPPATLLAQAAWKLKGSKLALGGQDCHPEPSGPYTGDISAPMLKDAGATYVIVGHSERRAQHHETDDLVRAKAQAALKAGLIPIVCIGETQAEREAGQQAAVVIRQLRRSLPAGATSDTVVIAYEPVWAIGTGLTPTPGDVAAIHNGIRALLAEVGGPSAAQNARSLRRLGQAEQLPRAPDPRQCRRRAGRRRKPQGLGLSGHRRRLSLKGAPDLLGWRGVLWPQ